MSTKRKLLLIAFVVAGVASMFARVWYQQSERWRMEQTLDSLAKYEREHPIAPPGVVAATPDAEEMVEETRDMFASELPRECLSAIRDAVGGEFKVMELSFADELVSAVVSTDGQSAHEYTLYRGRKKVEGPKDVNVIGDGGLADSLYELKQADLTLMPGLAKEALKRAGIEGARVTSMRFSYSIIRYKGETPEWTVSVERGSPPDWEHKFVTFDAKGKFKSVS
ncbi:MAG TPA: hypothetical protein VFA21_17600 [Pyrinomonadaceae bacterium]|nr:hypothetical protein [Pyrinomonadaceae bacterium]